MVKIRYQVMLEPRIYHYLQEKMQGYRHKVMGDTINWLIKQCMMLEQTAEKENKNRVRKKQTGKTLDDLADKYGINE